MKNKDALDNLLNIYIENAKIHEECTFSGNYKKGNKAFDKIRQIFPKIKELEHPKYKRFSKLLIHENLSVINFVAADLLDTTLREEAITALKNVILLDESIITFNAEMILKEEGVI